MDGGQAEPLILTAMLDLASHAWFERERQALFPPAINLIPAHVTLFHHLPGLQQPAIGRRLAELCQAQAPAAFSSTGLRFLGRGTAYALAMPAVAALRQSLAADWRPWLTAQDRQGWRPHVTVQNKVTPELARAVHRRLAAQFTPRTGCVTGLCLWRYLGGPWKYLGQYPFARGTA